MKPLSRLLAAGALLLAGAAHAQDWPVKPVRFIVPTSVGLSADIVGRVVADRLSKRLNQSFFVENLPGAGGALGYQAAARAPGDGYTMLMGTAGGLVVNTFVAKSLPYDPLRDFTPVAMVVNTGGFVIVVNPALPVKSIAELIALEKSKPGSLSYAFESSSSLSDVIGQALNQKAGMQMVGVPYKSSAQAIGDTVVGRTQVFIASVAAVHAAAESGKLRRIAMAGKKRFASLPDVPTLEETWPGFAFPGYLMTVTTAATPAPLVQRMNRATAEVLAEPEVVKRLNGLNLAIDGAGTPEGLKQVLLAEHAEAARIFRDIGFKPQD